MSVTTSNNLEYDVDELVNPTSAPASAEASNTEKFLEDMESILDSSEATGENLKPKLTEIANKRWGRKIKPTLKPEYYPICNSYCLGMILQNESVTLRIQASWRTNLVLEPKRSPELGAAMDTLISPTR